MSETPMDPDPMQDPQGVEPDPNSSSNEGSSGRAVDYDDPED
ncbi:MAG: hypothetical protein ABIN55_11620 [Aeromicrobium sp.]